MPVSVQIKEKILNCLLHTPLSLSIINTFSICACVSTLLCMSSHFKESDSLILIIGDTFWCPIQWKSHLLPMSHRMMREWKRFHMNHTILSSSSSNSLSYAHHPAISLHVTLCSTRAQKYHNVIMTVAYKRPIVYSLIPSHTLNNITNTCAFPFR